MENFTKSSELNNYMLQTLEKLKLNTPISMLLNQKYKEIEKKLPDDMKNLTTQYLLLFGLMIEEAEENPEFALQMLLPYKTWNRLYKFLDNLARPESKNEKGFRPRFAMVDSITVLSWIKEYYALDDHEDYEKEVEEKAAAEKKKREMDEKQKKQRESIKAKAALSNSTIDIITTENTVENKVPKKSKGDCNGQMDFFSMLQD